jgi:ribonuclease P protein component
MIDKYRLKKSKDIKAVMNFNRISRTGSFLAFVKPNALNHLRVGITTSKKLGNAVARVRLRRQVRAFFSVYNIYEKSYDIVIVVRQGFINKSFAENRNELLNRINLLMAKGENIK